MNKKYTLVKEYDYEKYFKEFYFILEDVEEGSWADEHKIAESNSVFDFIETDGNWAVKYKYSDFMFVVKEKIKKKAEAVNYEYYVFNEKLYFTEGDVGTIYHKDSKGNWMVIWSEENE